MVISRPSATAAMARVPCWHGWGTGPEGGQPASLTRRRCASGCGRFRPDRCTRSASSSHLNATGDRESAHHLPRDPVALQYPFPLSDPTASIAVRSCCGWRAAQGTARGSFDRCNRRSQPWRCFTLNQPCATTGSTLFPAPETAVVALPQGPAACNPSPIQTPFAPATRVEMTACAVAGLVPVSTGRDQREPQLRPADLWR